MDLSRSEINVFSNINYQWNNFLLLQLLINGEIKTVHCEWTQPFGPACMIYSKHKGDRPAILIMSDRGHIDKWLEERVGVLCLVRDKEYLDV